MKRRRIAMIAAAQMVLVVLWWFVIIAPRTAAQQERETSLDSIRASAATTHRALDAARRFAALGGGGPAELAALSALIPAQPELERFVMANTRAASLTGATVVSFTPEPPGKTAVSAPPGLQAIGIDETISGTPSEIGAYFDAVRNLNSLSADGSLGRLVTIDRIERANESSQRETMNLRLRLFTTAPPPAAGPAPVVTTPPNLLTGGGN